MEQTKRTDSRADRIDTHLKGLTEEQMAEIAGGASVYYLLYFRAKAEYCANAIPDLMRICG